METLSVYSPATLERKINIPLIYVGNNIKSILEKRLHHQLEGKCNVEGYIKNDSCVVSTYSCGLITGNEIQFSVAFDCQLCTPVEGMVIKCVVENITKAGIKASIPGEQSPLMVFIVRDHHFMLKEFSAVKVSDMIDVRITGHRYELNDEFISVIGEYIPTKKGGKQPRIVFKDN